MAEGPPGVVLDFTAKLVEIVTARNVCHNVVFRRTDSHSSSGAAGAVVEARMIPRKPQGPAGLGFALNVGAAEVCGKCICKDQHTYDNMTGKVFEEILREVVALPDAEFREILKEAVNISVA